jgi:GAF domain-containing protein
VTVPLHHGTVGELFWSTSEGVALLRGGRVIAWNPAAERLFGVPADVATGGSFELSSVIGDVAARLTGPEPPHEGPVRIRAGRARELTVEATAWRLRASDVSALVFRDVSGQVRYEQGLHRLAAFARDLLGARPDYDELAVHIAELAAELVDADFTMLLLDPPDSTGGADGYTVYRAPEGPGERVAGVDGLVARAVAGGRPLRVAEAGDPGEPLGVPLAHPPVGPVLAVPLLWGDAPMGELVAVGAPGRRPFGEADERLLGDLAAHACVALIWAQASEQRRIVVVGLRQAFGRLEEFANRLLLDERLVHEGAQPHWVDVELAPLLDTVCREHSIAAAGREVTVEAPDVPGRPDHLAGDHEMVRAVLDNLVSNAVKYSPPGSVVRVAARSQDGGFVRVEVTDSGPGIAVEDQQRLFDRFSRTDHSRRERIPGMGLGLSIVRRLVRAHGGAVGVDSTPGNGATFWATFPLTPPVAADAADTADTEDGGGEAGGAVAGVAGAGQPGSR